jgi:hypothetical protein
LHFQTLEEEEEEEGEEEENHRHRHSIFSFFASAFFGPRKFYKLHLLSMCSGLLSRLPRFSFLLFCGEEKRKMKVHCYFRVAC